MALRRARVFGPGLSEAERAEIHHVRTRMLRDFPLYNAVWAEYFPDAATAPCRTTVGITALPTPIAIELKCTAVVPDER